MQKKTIESYLLDFKAINRDLKKKVFENKKANNEVYLEDQKSVKKLSFKNI